MGWNTSYTILENTVITLYDANVLTKEILKKIVEPLMGTDCDSGGSRDLVAKDGSSFTHIVCKIMQPEETK